MMNNSNCKYDMNVNPVYQIDYQCKASGKRLTGSKRRVRFSFGFSNAEAIKNGRTGAECRGEEHEVVVVWSLGSRKRLVLFDDKEIHFSQGGKITDTKFETTWTMDGGHIIKVIANAAPALLGDSDYRQFDLILDGISFFDMHRVFELGLATNPKQQVKSGHYSFATTQATHSESRRQFYQYNEDSSENSMSAYSLPETPSTQDSFTSRRYESMPPTSPSSRYSPSSHGSHCISPETPLTDVLSEPLSKPDLFDSTPISPHSQLDEFTPRTPPPPTFDVVSSQIMSTYGPPAAPTPVMALTNAPHDFSAPYQQPVLQVQPAATTFYTTEAASPLQATSTSYGVSPDARVEAGTMSPTTVIPTMEPLSIQEMELREQVPMSEMEKALENLVHLDDIAETLETPEQIKSRKQKMSNAPIRSKPMPPTQADWRLGLNPSLGDIKDLAPEKAHPAKEIMRTHVFDPNAVHAGMMVVHGATTPSFIPQSQGFGTNIAQNYDHHQYHQHQWQQQQQQQQQVGYGHYPIRVN